MLSLLVSWAVGFFWIWMIYDFFSNRSVDDGLWTIVVFFTPLGAAVYFVGHYIPRRKEGQSDISESEDRYKELQSAGEDNLPEASLIELGDLHREHGRPQDALRCYGKALPGAFDPPRILNGMARCHTELKQPDEAIAALKKIDPEALKKDEEAVCLLADCLMAKKDYTGALEAVSGVPASGASVKVRYYHAVVLALNGRKGEASEILKSVVGVEERVFKKDKVWVNKSKQLLAKI